MNINLFEINQDNKFVRVYGKLSSTTEHELVIIKNNEKYVATSNYNLNNLLFGDVLAGFVKDSKIYPLPLQSQDFSDDLAINVYPKLTDEEKDSKIYDSEGIQRKFEKIRILSEQLQQMLDIQNDIEFKHSEISANLVSSQPDTEPCINNANSIEIPKVRAKKTANKTKKLGSWTNRFKIKDKIKEQQRSESIKKMFRNEER